MEGHCSPPCLELCSIIFQLLWELCIPGGLWGFFFSLFLLLNISLEAFFLFFFLRYDWYQTESQVIVTVMIKNAQKDGVRVQFSEKEVIYVGY